MDKLLSAINKKRVDLKELKRDKKWIKQSEEYEKRKIVAQEQFEKENEFKKRCNDEKLKVSLNTNQKQKIELFYDKGSQKTQDVTCDRTKGDPNKNLTKVDIPVEEVVKRLRRLRQPATLFGETHKKRCERLFSQENEVVDLEASQNIYVDTIMGRNNYLISKYINKSVSKVDFFDDYEDLANDPKHYRIFNWISQMLKSWEEQIKESKEELLKEGKEFEAKKNEAMLVQTKKDIKPLLKLIKSKKLEEDILEKMSKIVECCEKGEYKEAHDTYMLLAIGNAAWPMGVTMVGIHERAGRSKIFTSEVAHILNDETTRKYIQMFKRLISFSQTKYAKDPSKTVQISTVHI